MKLKTKSFALKKVMALSIILAMFITTAITTVYLLFSGKRVKSVETISATASGGLILGSLSGCNSTEMYTLDSNYYCADPNYASTRRLRNTKQRDDSPAAID